MDHSGGLEYGRLMAQSLTVRYGQPLHDLVSMIDERIQDQQERRLVLSTAIKDKGSALHILGSDIIRLIGSYTHTNQIVLWEDVLHAYIDHDILTTVS